jgi:hypothetical protein
MSPQLTIRVAQDGRKEGKYVRHPWLLPVELPCLYQLPELRRLLHVLL